MTNKHHVKQIDERIYSWQSATSLSRVLGAPVATITSSRSNTAGIIYGSLIIEHRKGEPAKGSRSPFTYRVSPKKSLEDVQALLNAHANRSHKSSSTQRADRRKDWHILPKEYRGEWLSAEALAEILRCSPAEILISSVDEGHPVKGVFSIERDWSVRRLRFRIKGVKRVA